MAVTYLRYLTENPYTKGYTLSAGQEIATPPMSDNVVHVVETSLGFSGGGRTSLNQAVKIGNISLPGIALAASVANTNWVPCRVGIPVRIVAMSVLGEDGAGNAAISIGETVYYDLGVLNTDLTNGSAWGIALAAVSSGATTVIPVLMLPFGVVAAGSTD